MMMVIISFYDNDVRHDCGVQGQIFSRIQLHCREIPCIMWFNNLIGIDRGYPGVREM